MITVTKLGKNIGASITGVDLSKPLDDNTFAQVSKAFFDNEVVVFPGQKLTPEQQIAFTQRFGPLEHHVRKEARLADHPEIFILSNKTDAKGNAIGAMDAGRFWHSDLSYKTQPSLLSALYALEIPVKDGKPLGDTHFASSTAAYNALPEAMKQKLAGLKNIHSYRDYRIKNYAAQQDDMRRGIRTVQEHAPTPEQLASVPDMATPVVRVHPVTGRKGLFVSEGHTSHMYEMPQEEGDQLLRQLYDHITSPEFIYTHHWTPGDLLMWDNIAVQHKATFDYDPFPRLLYRTTVRGPAVADSKVLAWKKIRILSATGILGSGFREETLKRAMTLKPDFIGSDAGSTDPGPHHLGSGEPQFSDAACKRDLRLMIMAARAAKIPVMVGSAMTAGTDAQVDRLAGIVREIAREEKLNFKLATIYSEQDRNYLKKRLKEGRIKPLANAPVFGEGVIDRSSHIVGMCGAEPYIEALQNGADVVIAGRSSDTSIFAAMPVMKGFNPATVWHMAKIMECGAASVVLRKYPDCNFAIVTDDHFIIEPPNPDYRCDPTSVASHNLYENSTPYELIEPSGILNTVNARYEAISDRAVKVSGSTFKKAERYTIKLEGAELAGYQSIVLGSVRDPIILRQFDHWLENLVKAAKDRIRAVMGDSIDSQYRLDIRQFGRNAAMGVLEPDMSIGHEVGLLFQITAPTQKLANSLAKSLSHIAVHYPVPEWTGLITSVAFPYSPAEIDKGASYRFNMNHVVEPDSPLEMFRLNYESL